MKPRRRNSAAFVCLALVVLIAAASGQRATGAKKTEAISAEAYSALLVKVNNAGRWGKDDSLGTINLITAEKRVQAAREVQAGVSVSLARPLAPGDVAGALEPMQMETLSLPSGDIHWHAERLQFVFHGYAFTHVDALSHAAFRDRVYNGRSEPKRHLEQLSVQHMRSGLVSRGVLVDLPLLRGVEFLEPGAAYTPADMEAWEKKTGIRVGSGDVLLVRTGRWARQRAHGPVDPTKLQAGPHPSMAAWLHERGVAIVGDDGANDVAPTLVAGVTHPFHQLALVGMGMPLLDNLDLDALAHEASARSRWTFMFVASPLPIEKGTGSPLNPLAIF